MKVTLVFLLVALTFYCQAQSQGAKQTHGSGNWDYDKKGTDWGGDCKGSSQSPINIVTCEAEKGSFFNRIISHNYWKESTGTYRLHNNGHCLQIDLPKSHPYQLKKGQKTYIPLQIHIHFNAATGKGSEHTLNSKQYFAEIHIVHRNSMYATNFMGKPDGLLVIGVFVDLVKKAVLKYSSSTDLDFSMKHLESPSLQMTKIPNDRTSFAMQLFGFGAEVLANPKTERDINAFPLAWLLPTVDRKKSMWDYVNYRGSLTTPPCSEIVDWIVVTGKTLEINRETAKKFKGVKNSSGKMMSGNFRPIQDMNGREVYGVEGSL